MNTGEHLTENQLAEYFGGALAPRGKHAAGRHLLQCDFCLKRLPQPTHEQFLAALMTDAEFENDSRDGKTTLAVWLDSIVKSLKQPKILVLGASALAIALFFSAFIWLNAVKSSETEREVAVNFEMKDTPSPFIEADDNKINLSQPNSTVETMQLTNKTENNIADNSNADVRKTPVPVEKRTQLPATRKPNLSKTQNQKNEASPTAGADNQIVEIASVRGNTKEDKTNSIDTRLVLTDGSLKLSWSKYPQADNYSVVIIDAESNEPVEEIRLGNQTETLISLKKFEPSKKYEVKVVTVLPNGTIKTSKTFTFTKNAKKH